MPVAVMEPLEAGLSPVDKKKSGDPKGGQKRSILDFFKTPEKEMGLKQKGLMQYFKRSPVTTRIEDKENNGAATKPEKAEATEDDSIIFLDSSMDGDNSIESSDSVKEKNGINSKAAEEGSSVPASCEEKCHTKPKHKKKKERMESDASIKSKISKKTDNSNDLGQLNNCVDDGVVSNSEVDSLSNAEQGDPAVNENEKKELKKNSVSVTTEDTKEEVPQTEPVLPSQDVSALINVEDDDDDTGSNKSTSSVRKKRLKGKDMLDVLRQVKKKEKHKKHKKKHRESKNNSSAEDDKVDSLPSVCEVPDSMGAVQEETKNVDITNNQNQAAEETEPTDVKESKLKRKKKSKLKKVKKSKEAVTEELPAVESSGISYSDFLKKLEQKSETGGVQDSDKFHDDEEEPCSVKEEKKGGKEMSYTEFMDLLSKGAKSATCDDEVDGSVDETNVENAAQKNDVMDENDQHDSMTETLPKAVGKASIARFFTKTSTPGSKKNIESSGAAPPQDREKHNSKSTNLDEEPAVSKKKKGKTGKKEPAKSVCADVEMRETTEVCMEEEDDVSIVKVSTKATVKDNVPEMSEGEKAHLEEQKKQKLAFLTSQPSSAVSSSKKMQATLSFGKSGLTMSKPPIDKKPQQKDDCPTEEEESKTDATVNVADIPKSAKKTSKKTPAKPTTKNPKTKKSLIKKKEAQLLETPELQKDDHVSDELETSDITDITDTDSSTRRSMRKKYHVALFQMDADRKTPIKIKLRRCNKSSSSGDDSAFLVTKPRKGVQGNAKMTKAQELLDKAKKGKQKKAKGSKKKLKLPQQKDKNDERLNQEEGTDSDNQRRSSRLCGRKMASMEEIVIFSSSEDELEVVMVETPKKKVGRKPGKAKAKVTEKQPSSNVKGKGTPIKPVAIKNTPKKKQQTPSKKPGMKLASIFLSKKAAAASPVKPRPLLDPAQEKQRQLFLMSGVPEELKKNTTRISTSVTLDYPPFPTVNHVQQLEEVSGSSQEIKQTRIKMKQTRTTRAIRKSWSSSSLGLNLNIDVTKQQCEHLFMSFSSHPDLPCIDACMTEVMRHNPSYPVHKMFSRLHDLKKLSETTSDGSDSVDMEKAAEPTEIVIDLEENTSKPTKRGRKSLKLKDKEAAKEIEQKEEEKKNLETPKQTGSWLLWTDKYQPANSVELIGNGTCIKKLKSWLSDWKHMLDKEARKARKLLMSKNRGKLSKKEEEETIWDDDSDFDLDSDDSDEDDNSLCNTMLITGPHGSGKTSAVYGLAQELGFKVHEVNASVSRNGKRILSQLQEATQSHQVSHHGCSTPNKPTGPGTGNTPLKKLVPTTFTNLFKKMGGPPAPENKEIKPEEDKKKKKRKRDKMDKDGSPKTKRLKSGDKNSYRKTELSVTTEEESQTALGKGLNLSSTTLILFDEADIVLEDDKGFLSAVQTFMATTKIPIILTVSSRGFAAKFGRRFEQLIFRPPPLVTLTSHLQLVCLIENVRTSRSEIVDIVQLCQGDVRKSLLALQFWVESGGGVRHSFKPLPKPVTSDLNPVSSAVCTSEDSQSIMGMGTDNSVQAEENNMDDDDDDFVNLKPMHSKRRRLVVDDDSSNHYETATAILSVKNEDGISQNSSDACDNRMVPVHGLCLNSILGMSAFVQETLSTTLLECVTDSSRIDFTDTTTLCEVYRQFMCYPFYNNMLKLLPLTTGPLEAISVPCKTIASGRIKGKKRKRIQSDLYDSEASCDSIAETDIPEQTLEENIPSAYSKEEKECLQLSLEAFSNFYDNMSFLDEMETQCDMKVMDVIHTHCCNQIRGSIQYGSEDSLSNLTSPSSVDFQQSRQLGSELELRSFRKFYRQIESVKTKKESLSETSQDLSSQFVLPEPSGVVERTTARTNDGMMRAEDNMRSHLPLIVEKSRRCITLDYLPTLREISRTEQNRFLGNTKRRFHHYFDTLGFTVKETTLSLLSTAFS